MHRDLYDIFEHKVSTTKYDVYVLDDDTYIDVMLPGFEKDNIKIDYFDKKLSINAKRTVDENKRYQIKKSFFGEFEETFIIGFEPEEIEGGYENGVLTLKLKRSEKEKPKIKF